MSDASERFLDLATKPFEGNHELHVHARWKISSKLKPGADGELGVASRILEERDRSRWRTMTARWIGWAVVLTILLYGGIQVHQLNESRQILGLLINPLDHIGDWTHTTASYVEHSLESRNSLDRLLLETDRTKATDAAKRLWDHEPANAALFANYAAFHFQEHKELPPDFLETAERLDPDNGWFLVLAAAAFADGSVKGESSSSSGKGPRMAQKWTILNAEEHERAIDCLHQASHLPRFESYQGMLRKRRRSLLPPDTDAHTILMNSSCCETAAPSSSGIPLQLAHAIAAKAQILATAGDTAGFKSLLAEWMVVSKTIIAQPDSGVFDRMVQKVLIAAPVRNLKEAAEKLGFADEARRLNEVDTLIESHGKERRSRDLSARDLLIEDHGSVLGQLSLTTLGLTVKRPLTLNDGDLMPSLRVDHSLFSSAVAVLLAAMFLVIAVATRAYRFRYGRLCCELAGVCRGFLPREIGASSSLAA